MKKHKTISNIHHIDKSWSLFLDRDGVINKRRMNDYIKTVDEFEFIQGVPEALKICSGLFGHLFVVTNQQGISKGLMDENALNEIHNHFLNEIIDIGGKIDRIYYCTDLADSDSSNRKPEIGMALLAKKDFPSIDFHKSIMIGDSITDMVFGKKVGMKTVFLGNKNEKYEVTLVDMHLGSLLEFANYIKLQTKN